MAHTATLSFQVVPFKNNINLTWDGFSDSMPVFINETLTRIMDMNVVEMEEVFDQVKEKLLQDYKNAYLDQSYM